MITRICARDFRGIGERIDLEVLRASQARSFRTLENALRFLAAPGSFRVYPPPRP
ncbi:hypothetical protein WME99_13235 [Sorangium sp. So ce136]|uniref:hypothetical protein n=1 Tax=Sorangium sp. So ce136 TaxID=3133284 RepID=UPI003EFFB4CD